MELWLGVRVLPPAVQTGSVADGAAAAPDVLAAVQNAMQTVQAAAVLMDHTRPQPAAALSVGELSVGVDRKVSVPAAAEPAAAAESAVAAADATAPTQQTQSPTTQPRPLLVATFRLPPGCSWAEDEEAALAAAYTGPGELETVCTAPYEIPLYSADCAAHCTTAAAMAAAESPVQERFLDVGLLLTGDAVVSAQQLSDMRAEVSQRIAQADAALATRGIAVGTQNFVFAEISSRGQQRFDLLLEPAAAPTVFAAATAGAWTPLVRRLLGAGDEAAIAVLSPGQPPPADGQAIQVDVSAVYSRPGAGEQVWHADGPHLQPGRPQVPPYGLCVFMPLIDLCQPRVGFTQFWPRTHHAPGLAGFGPVAPLLDSAVDGRVPAGCAVMYDYRLMHRGMPNTADVERPLVQFFYHRSTYQEKRNYGEERLLEGESSKAASGASASISIS